MRGNGHQGSANHKDDEKQVPNDCLLSSVRHGMLHRVHRGELVMVSFTAGDSIKGRGRTLRYKPYTRATLSPRIPRRACSDSDATNRSNAGR
jgi:hypothetical protein